jgi:hypothetical protein
LANNTWPDVDIRHDRPRLLFAWWRLAYSNPAAAFSVNTFASRM